MRLSVVINTCDRGASLRQTLRSLAFQTWTDFEVVVVNGPSSDETGEVLEAYAGRIKVRSCPQRNLSVSRNIGIDAASGDVVAFIDDDALATPTWLADLAGAYADAAIGGAGGKVYDHTGLAVQDHYVVCHRLGGRAQKDVVPPLDRFLGPGADPFLHLLGTNASFRREALAAIGGFDEEYEYFLDETDLCMRLVDAGYRLVVHPRAVVHHKFLASHLRTVRRVLFDPYPVAKNIVYFSLQNDKERHLPQLESRLDAYLDERRQEGASALAHGLMTREQADFFTRRFDEGVRDGRKRAREPRLTRDIQPLDPDAFVPFPTLRPAGGRLTLCFASREYPPRGYGGIGRYTFDLATGFAAGGHEVHVVTSSRSEASYVDFEDDVWVHRLAEQPIPGLENHVLGPALSLGLRNWREAWRIHKESPLDVFLAPIWMVEGGVAATQQAFPTIISFMTTHRQMQEVDPSFGGAQYLDIMVPFEKAVVGLHRYGHAISQGILDRVAMDYGLPRHTFVAPLCVRDLAGQLPVQGRGDGRVRLLFVGRLEPRKGIDVLLDAAEAALTACPELEIVLVGRNVWPSDTDPLVAFQRRHVGDSDILDRLLVAGEVDEAQLQAHYAACDIFCLPSRYESFGLVLLEAMVFAKPCIACRVGGMVDVVEDGVTGLFFPKEDAAALAGHIVKLVRDPALRRSLGQAGRARYERLFSPRAVTDRLEIQYRDVMADFAGERAVAPAAGSLPDLLAGSGIAQESIGFIVDRLFDETVPSPEARQDSRLMRLLRRCEAVCFRRAPGLTMRLKNKLRPVLLIMLPKILRAVRHHGGHVKKQLLRIVPATKSNVRALHEQLSDIQTSQGVLYRYHCALHDKVEDVQNVQRILAAQVDGVVRHKVMEFEERLQTVLTKLATNEELLIRTRNEILFELLDHKQQSGSATATSTTWKVLNESLYAQASASGVYRLNLGCGHIPVEGYLNVDMRAIAGVDIVGDALDLRFEPGTVREIRSAHLLEHFSRQNLQRHVLPYWRSLLEPDGELRLIVPDAEAMLEAYAAGEMPFDALREVTFGLQEYAGDFHYTMFSRLDLERLLKAAGFKQFCWVARGRPNGLCREMEITAVVGQAVQA